MTINRLETGQRMSQIVIHNDTIYLAGQVAKSADGDVQEQTRTTLEKIETLLSKAGSDPNHILSAIIYLRDIKDFAAMNEVWDAWVPAGQAPARACVEARLARPDLLVEISVVAAVKQ
ncbi:MAG: RidA family protein [Anaerolineae bacterium]|nr:RidA family protein [Anaerolineae bacterium]